MLGQLYFPKDKLLSCKMNIIQTLNTQTNIKHYVHTKHTQWWCGNELLGWHLHNDISWKESQLNNLLIGEYHSLCSLNLDFSIACRVSMTRNTSTINVVIKSQHPNCSPYIFDRFKHSDLVPKDSLGVFNRFRNLTLFTHIPIKVKTQLVLLKDFDMDNYFHLKLYN
jgi:hypothetical protein